MNTLGIKSLTASNVLLDILDNYGETYKEVMMHTGLKKNALLVALRELTSLGLVQKFKDEGSREYMLRATLPRPITEATILERCIKADEDDSLNAKVLVTISEIESVFPRGSYQGKEPGYKQAIRWLGKMGDSSVKLFGLLEEARGVTLTEGGPINYVEKMIANEAEPTFSEIAAHKQRQKKVNTMLVARELMSLEVGAS